LELTGRPPAIILAGGAARRMGGGDKSLLSLGGRPILQHVVERLQAQAGPLAISANGDPGRFASWGLPVLPDEPFVGAGPLAGILAGMRWALSSLPSAEALVSIPADTPFLPADFVPRLANAGGRIAIAASGGRTHFAAALWSLRLATDLQRALAEGVRKVERFAERYRPEIVEFSTDPVDPFFNINRPEDLEEAEELEETLHLLGSPSKGRV
jgi:molybdopterin-guanine dinucleotide biosynthesis protein A